MSTPIAHHPGGADGRGAAAAPVIRVLVVEDQRAFAGALEVAIAMQPDLDCVGAVATAEEGMDLVAAACPDVVLMDIRLPGMDGIEGTRRILAAHPGVRVLILTAATQPGRLADAAASGAARVLAKDSAFADILAAIRDQPAAQAGAGWPAPPVPPAASLRPGVTGGETALAGPTGREPALAGPTGGETALAGPPTGREPALVRLTGREREVLALMGEGLGPRAIARSLVVSPHTARGHVKNIMMKLGAHSQLEAVVVAGRAGLLPGSPAVGDPS